MNSRMKASIFLWRWVSDFSLVPAGMAGPGIGGLP